MTDDTDVPPKYTDPPGIDDERVDIEPEERYKLFDPPRPAKTNRTERKREIPSAPPITDGVLEADENRRDTWLHYNKGLKNKGHTPAKVLTPDNVQDLEREWAIAEDTGGLQTQPIVAPGDPPVMYYTVWGQEHVVAVNARTGEEYWRFKSGREEIVGGGIPVNRGVGIWKDKVYYLSDEMILIAIDRFTGEEVWETSILTEDPEVGEQTPIRTYITQAPQLYDGKVIFGQSSDRAEWTEIICVDAESGEMLWHTPTYISKDKWAGDTWRISSAAAWQGVAIDPDSDSVVFHTGNADPAAWGPYRPGPNRASEGIGALDAQTGEVKWTNQLMAHEIWDWDVSTRPQIHDVEINGESRRVVTSDWKGGYSVTIDMETGRTIARSEPLAPVEDKLRHHPLGVDNRERVQPAAQGCKNWPPDTYNPNTGLKYINVMDNSSEFWSDNGWQFDPDSDAFVGSGWWWTESGERERPYVTAVDPVSGEIHWIYEFDDGFNTAHSGGITSTDGDLIFAASNGGNLVALNLDGNELWVDDTEGRIQPAPCVWDDVTRRGRPKGYVTVVSDNRIITYTH